MMDPVRADGVGLLHFLEALRAGDAAHVARSLGYEAAFLWGLDTLICSTNQHHEVTGLGVRVKNVLTQVHGEG